MAMSNANLSSQRMDPIFESYVALARGLIGDLDGICMLDGAFKPRADYGELRGEPAATWIRSLGWDGDADCLPAAIGRGQGVWWVGIPLCQSDGKLLGIFCVSRKSTALPIQPSRFASDLASRLKPLLDCIHRDLMAALAPNIELNNLTERSAELEWLFKVTSNLKGAVDDRRVIEELLAAATSRLKSEFGVLYVPDKRLTVKCQSEGADSLGLVESWQQTKDHLITWAQRQKRPLVLNSVGREKKSLRPCKLLCVPVMRETDRVIGVVAFYNPPQSADYQGHQVFLARHIGRQAASLVEAQFDLMTGLYTRAGLDQMYSGLTETDDFIESSVIYVDIDHMHIVNELHGFELGNELIVRVAETLSSPLLPADALAGRISADRFAIVLPKNGPSEAVKLAQQLQAAASGLVIGPSKTAFDVSISCGVSELMPMPQGLARAIAAAELACKTAKNRGRNRVELYACDDATMMRHHGDAFAVGQLRSALKDDRLVLYAQRITPLQNAKLPGGYEVLLRLRDIDGTLISPGPLIDAAQRFQLLPTIDRWVVQRALQMLAPYRGMLGARGLGMSINVSGQSIGDDTFIRQFIQQLKDARLPSNCVSVELTEQAAITNIASAKQMVSRLGALGCRVALDDFGTGANSLSYLKALQVARVKIDGSFVRDILTDRNSKATVHAIVELAKGMGIETVAEYVESEAIARELRVIGVDYAQGYAFGKPTPLCELLDELARDESVRLHRLFLEI